MADQIYIYISVHFCFGKETKKMLTNTFFVFCNFMLINIYFKYFLHQIFGLNKSLFFLNLPPENPFIDYTIYS